MCITPILASDFFQATSITTNGNQILSQSGIANENPRNLFMNYYNSLNYSRGTKMDVEEYFSGIIMPQSAFNTVVGTEELSITHPGFSAGLGSLANGYADCDVDPYPRAIVSKIYTYNFECNLPPSNAIKNPQNAYFCGRLDSSLDAAA